MKFKTKTIQGKGRGKKLLGYPTLNLEIPTKLDAEFGIYAGHVYVHDQTFLGAFHYGPIPTFKENSPSLEVFVLDKLFEDKPEELEFELIERLRDIKTFDTFELLRQQISQDVQATKSLLDHG